MNDHQLYNSRIINTFIKLIKRNYSHVNVMELLNYAGMELYQVEDEGHWFSQEQVDLFYERIVQLTGNPKIAREAGRYASSPDAIGIMRQYALGMVGPARVFEMIGDASRNFTRSSTYNSRKLSQNKVEVVVTPHPGVTERPYQCDNRMGCFEAIVLGFNYRLPIIEHSECIFSGGKVCRYTITWQKSPAANWRRISNYATLLLLLGCLASFFLLHSRAVAYIAPLSLSLVLLFHYISSRMEIKELSASVGNLWDSTDKLLEQTSVNYNNACLVNDIGQVISRQPDVDHILANVIQVLKDRLDYDRGMILLINSERTVLEFRAGFGYSDELAGFLKNTKFHVDRPDSKGVFVISFRNQRSFLINDFSEIAPNLSAASLAFAKKIGTQSFVCCPIICEGESIGILAVDNLETKKALIQSDMSLLMGIAPLIGISIRNAILNEERERQFQSTLQTLAASIDARDNLTAGHAERVTEYAVAICTELGLSKDFTEMVRVASLLHDYGKIGIPDSILKKDGALTDDEYNQVKAHASKTREILGQINFKGIYQQVPEAAASHHEKIDGSGYPLGLKGDEIPYGAKIIAVADFFEAITSKRHYRDPMPFAEALKLLEEKRGTHFDSGIIDAFVHYLKENFGCRNEGSSGLLYAVDNVRKIPFRAVADAVADAGKTGNGVKEMFHGTENSGPLLGVAPSLNDSGVFLVRTDQKKAGAAE